MNNKFIKSKIKYKKGGTSPPINTAVKFPPEDYLMIQVQIKKMVMM